MIAATGARLNHPETVALLSCWVIEGACDGRSVAELMEDGRRVLMRAEIMDGVAEMVAEGPGRGDLPRRAQARQAARARHMIPGELRAGAGAVELNAGRERGWHGSAAQLADVEAAHAGLWIPWSRHVAEGVADGAPPGA